MLALARSRRQEIVASADVRGSAGVVQRIAPGSRMGKIRVHLPHLYRPLILGQQIAHEADVMNSADLFARRIQAVIEKIGPPEEAALHVHHSEQVGMIALETHLLRM